MQILGLNTLDLLLIVIVVIGILIGMVRGATPLIISMVSIWLGLFATLWLYKLFSRNILQGVGLGSTSSDMVSFLLVLTIMFHAVRLVIRMLSTPPEERKKKKKDADTLPGEEVPPSAVDRFVLGPLNLLVGMVLGGILTALWLAIILGALQFVLQPTELSAEVTGFARRITLQFRGSALLPIFNSILWLLSSSLDLFIPRDADIFRRVLRLIS